MKIEGCCLSISYNAVVPDLAWPTMKKSGSLLTVAAEASCRSADAVIAPERDEIAPEILAQRFDLALVAPAQLEHELVVWRMGIAVEHPIARRDERAASKTPRRQRLHKGVRRRARGSMTHRHRVHQ